MVFWENFIFLTGVTLKFDQKPNTWPKNNLFLTFSRKCFAIKFKNNIFWIKHVLSCFIILINLFLKNYILKNFVSVAPSSGLVGKIILICTTAFNTLQLGQISKFFQLLVSEKMNFEQKRRFWTTVRGTDGKSKKFFLHFLL